MKICNGGGSTAGNLRIVQCFSTSGIVQRLAFTISETSLASMIFFIMYSEATYLSHYYSIVHTATISYKFACG
jgi:hypothetical protein